LWVGSAVVAVGFLAALAMPGRRSVAVERSEAGELEAIAA
jgi:hypothetical protein